MPLTVKTFTRKDLKDEHSLIHDLDVKIEHLNAACTDEDTYDRIVYVGNTLIKVLKNREGYCFFVPL